MSSHRTPSLRLISPELMPRNQKSSTMFMILPTRTLHVLLAAAFTLALGLALTGCGKSDSGSSTSPGAAPSAPGQVKTIGVAFETLQTEGWVAGFEAIKAELKKRNITMLEAVADGDASRQLQQVKNFITRGVDGIILVPKDAKTVAGRAKQDKLCS